jgi:hypothetical protein
MIAYCYRSGHIGYCRSLRTLPAGANPLADGPAKLVTKAVWQTGRLSRVDNQTFFVPGIPEAESDNDKARLAAEDYAVTLRDRISSLRKSSRKAVRA